MVTYCWPVMRHVAPRIHRHAAHLAHRSGRILHRLPKVAHLPIAPALLVCRALPLALTGASLLNIVPTEPPGYPVTPPSYIQPVQQGYFVPPYLPPGLPPFPTPFVCCVGQFQPLAHPAIKLPPPDAPEPSGDPPVITTFAFPNPSPNSVGEPSSRILVMGALASLLILRRTARAHSARRSA